jgi:hypothetical protein
VDLWRQTAVPSLFLLGAATDLLLHLAVAAFLKIGTVLLGTLAGDCHIRIKTTWMLLLVNFDLYDYVRTISQSETGLTVRDSHGRGEERLYLQDALVRE